MKDENLSPVSYQVHVARLPAKGMPIVIDAEESELYALARAHELEAVNEFHVELLVAPWRRDGVRITGQVAAKVVQSCVITLVPVESEISTEIDVTLVPENSRLARVDNDDGGEILLDPDGQDAPDVFSGDSVDVGAIAEEFFELAIDPYPRAPGAELQNDPEPEPEKPPSPFEKLAQLRRKD